MERSTAVKEKRKIPAFLQNLLRYDVAVTDVVCNWANKTLPKTWHMYYKALEVSCHGIPWLGCWLAFIWLWNSPPLYQMQVNFFIGLLLDIVVVSVLKAITRRRRPMANSNDMFVAVSVDKFSFPSGHATRACFIAHFFIYVFPLSSVLHFPLLIWSAAVCISRILLRRHHVVDVIAGAIVGFLESELFKLMWLSNATCVWLLSLITEERLEGAEYHV